MDNAPPSAVTDFVRSQGGHSVISKVRLSTLPKLRAVGIKKAHFFDPSALSIPGPHRQQWYRGCQGDSVGPKVGVRAVWGRASHRVHRHGHTGRLVSSLLSSTIHPHVRRKRLMTIRCLDSLRFAGRSTPTTFVWPTDSSRFPEERTTTTTPTSTSSSMSLSDQVSTPSGPVGESSRPSPFTLSIVRTDLASRLATGDTPRRTPSFPSRSPLPSTRSSSSVPLDPPCDRSETRSRRPSSPSLPRSPAWPGPEPASRTPSCLPKGSSPSPTVLTTTPASRHGRTDLPGRRRLASPS